MTSLALLIGSSHASLMTILQQLGNSIRLTGSRPLRLAQYGDGARASARFNVQNPAAQETTGLLELRELKRRERRAPLRPNCVTLIYAPQ